jgi:ubiquitin-hydrolase Zn-finger-containing protein
MSTMACTHLDKIQVTNTSEHVCEDCIKLGDSWIHLRMCLSCGHVGCCDSSRRRKAREPWHSTARRIAFSSHPCAHANSPSLSLIEAAASER